MKELFESKLSDVKLKNNSNAIESEEKYKELMNVVLKAKSKKNKTSAECRRLKKYDVLSIGESMKLIVPLQKCENNQIKMDVHNEEFFEMLQKVRRDTGHGGLNKMYTTLKDDYANVTRGNILIYLTCCETCTKRRVHP